MQKRALFIIPFCAILLLSSCSKYTKLLKSPNAELKYTKAIEYFNKGDYNHAMQLFDQVALYFRATDKAENIAYYNAYCYYKLKDYMMAGHYFRAFALQFPFSKYTEECSYMSAYCNYLDSPRYNLDQTSTKDAIQALQSFINRYPESPRIEDCNKLIDELRAKLEKKDLIIAQFYYRVSDYNACIISLTNLIKDFPDSKNKEDILYQLLQAKYNYAVKSIPEKRNERVEDAKLTCNELINLYPGGKYFSEAKSIQAKLAQ